MKKRFLALILSAVMLTGCSSMLERSYESTATHVERPTTAEDSSILRVENYRELVSAVLYLVSQGQEEGVIQLYDYADDVEADLTAACLEVATEDPLGAYAVDYIKHEYTRVVSYYQATVSIRYRRTAEQIRSIVNVTGTGAIRDQLREALSRFSPEVVLRVAYFAEDADSIARLIRQAYYDTPVTALGMPQADIALYPDSGSQRMVEIRLTYPEVTEKLRQKSEELAARAGGISAALRGLDERTAAFQAAGELAVYSAYAAAGGSTAYDALAGGFTDAEGLSLAYALLCQQAGLSCEVVEGERLGQGWFWDCLQMDGGEKLYLDPALGDRLLRTGEELAEFGYRWPEGPEPEGA